MFRVSPPSSTTVSPQIRWSSSSLVRTRSRCSIRTSSVSSALGASATGSRVEQQEPLAAIQAERPELVGGLRPLHSATNISEEKRSPIVRTSDRSPG